MRKPRRGSDKFLTGAQFRMWRLSRGLTLMDVGAILGLTHQAISQYESRGTSKAVALALAALDRGLKPWFPTKEDQVDASKRTRGDPHTTEF